MIKLNCNSREHIIDFIEKSDKFPLLRIHYSNIQIQAAFNKCLRDITKLKGKENVDCSIIHWQKSAVDLSLIQFLENYLKVVGVKVSCTITKKYQSLDQLIQEPREEEYKIYFLPSDSIETVKEDSSLDPQPIQKTGPQTKNVLFLLPQRENNREISEKLLKFDFIDLTKQESYYSLFFEVITKLYPNRDFSSIISKFTEQYETRQASNSSINHLYLEDKEVSKQKSSLKQAVTRNILQQGKGLILSSIFVIGIICLGVLLITGRSGEENKENYALNQSELQKQEGGPIRSDLIIPTESAFLNRPELIAQIEDKLKKQTGIQTIALSGPGGAGKTTLARQYAHQQKNPLIWEIKAETHESLNSSFEDLSQALAKTEEDQKSLKEIKTIRNPAEKEEKLLQFVKAHLKFTKNWLLIYDNIETFVDAQKYFPYDPATWGEGKIILTTRDSNIENNKHVNHVIPIGELNPNQKFTLFTKIKKNKDSPPFTVAQAEEIKLFLEKIPPFPLDVSIAAYYIKTTNVSYDQYLMYLKNFSEGFENINENILKEINDYKKTRYNIISLSFKELIETHKDFLDLLLLICLLDSQNIPRDLLVTYKGEAVVDNFIYHLKKYSFITPIESFSSSLPITFSIHRSTQAIGLNYLFKRMNVEKAKEILRSITHILENFMNNVIEKENFLMMKLLLNHCNKFLNHNILPEDIRGLIGSNLGFIYFYLGNNQKAEEIVKASIKKLNLNYCERYIQIARSLTSLGNIYRGMGDYENAKKVLEQSFAIHKKHSTGNHVQFAWSLVSLGIVYINLGHFEKAKNLLEKSAHILKALCGDDDIRVYWPISHLGITYEKLGYYEKAKALLEQSYMIYKKHLGNSHPKVAWILYRIGSIYRALENYEKAKDLLEQSYIIYKQHLPENHPEIIKVLIILGNVYGKLDNYEKAKDLLERSLIIYEKNYGKDHILTAEVLRNLGEVYLLDGHKEEAEKLFKKSLSLFQQNKHSESYKVLENLAELYLKKSTHEKNKGNMLQSQNFKKQALDCLKQALEIIKTSFPKDSPHMARIQAKLKNLECLKIHPKLQDYLLLDHYFEFAI